VSEIPELTPAALVVRRRYMPVLVVVIACAILCIGTTGVYLNSTLQASKSADDIDELKRQLAAQKLEYEQRLGTQSAAYAVDATNFGNAVQSFADALKKMDAKNDRRAAERERAQLEAMIAAQKAVAVVSATAQKTDQILVKQEATQQRRTA
jgi:hypothetical protein